MEVIVIESEAFKRLEHLIERAAKASDDKDEIFNLEQAGEYIGVTGQWVYARRDRIGYIQEGKILRFRKKNIDKYLDSISIAPKGVNKFNTKSRNK